LLFPLPYPVSISSALQNYLCPLKGLHPKIGKDWQSYLFVYQVLKSSSTSANIKMLLAHWSICITVLKVNKKKQVEKFTQVGCKLSWTYNRLTSDITDSDNRGLCWNSLNLSAKPIQTLICFRSCQNRISQIGINTYFIGSGSFFITIKNFKNNFVLYITLSLLLVWLIKMKDCLVLFRRPSKSWPWDSEPEWTIQGPWSGIS